METFATAVSSSVRIPSALVSSQTRLPNEYSGWRPISKVWSLEPALPVRTLIKPVGDASELMSSVVELVTTLEMAWPLGRSGSAIAS